MGPAPLWPPAMMEYNLELQIKISPSFLTPILLLFRSSCQSDREIKKGSGILESRLTGYDVLDENKIETLLLIITIILLKIKP